MRHSRTWWCWRAIFFDNEYAAVLDPEKIAALLRGIRSRFGVYACWGNHDVSEQLLAGFFLCCGRPRCRG